MKPLHLAKHARDRMAEYAIPLAWVEAAVREPDWSEPDPRPGIERRFLQMAERGGRYLRVACIEEDDHIRVLSVHPDRDARPPDAP